MSRDRGLFIDMLTEANATLILDNDMCILRYVSESGDKDNHMSFDFGPKELVFILAELLEIGVENV